MGKLRLFVAALFAAALAVLPVRAIEKVGDVYQVTKAADLMEFADMVNGGANTVSCVFTSDIDMTGVAWTPIGTEANPFKGTINGQFHKISNLVVDAAGTNYIGLVGYLSDGATIENLVIDGTCSFTGSDYLGAFAGGSTGSGNAYFRNLGNEANVTGTGANAAAIVGVSMAGACVFHVTNCYNSGNITGGRESAAITGWGGGGEVNGFFNVGTISGLDGDNKLYRNLATATNCWDVEGKQGTAFTAEDLASGLLAFKLNGSKANDSVTWRQNLDIGDADATPTILTSHGIVYPAGEIRCDSAVLEGQTFSNTNSTVVPPHQYEDGVCTVCGNPDLNYMTPVDSVYEIGTAEQLNWFASLVNHDGTKHKYSARITADIDFSEYSSQDVLIGLGGNDFTGVFDGQMHTITVNYNTDQQLMGLFRFAKNSVIRNLIVEGSITSSAEWAAGIAAYIVGATTVENCISKVNIVANKEADCTDAGIAARSDAGSIIRNCAFLGSITGPGFNNGGILGWD